MQDLGSVQHLYFLKVVGFPIGLSPRIMQDLGSVQNLDFFKVVGFSIGFESEDHAKPWFYQKLRFS